MGSSGRVVLEVLKKYVDLSVCVAFYCDVLSLMNLEFLHISVSSSSLIRNDLLIPSSDGISWIISPVVSQRLL